MDRKDFFQTAFQLAIKKGLEIATENPLIKSLEKLSEEEVIKQRPPGAAALDETFRKLCTGCDACMIACPVNIIMIEDLERRYPLIYPEKAPCLHCDGYPCIQSCPSGALDLANGTSLRKI